MFTNRIKLVDPTFKYKSKYKRLENEKTHIILRILNQLYKLYFYFICYLNEILMKFKIKIFTFCLKNIAINT